MRDSNQGWSQEDQDQLGSAKRPLWRVLDQHSERRSQPRLGEGLAVALSAPLLPVAAHLGNRRLGQRQVRPVVRLGAGLLAPAAAHLGQAPLDRNQPQEQRPVHLGRARLVPRKQGLLLEEVLAHQHSGHRLLVKVPSLVRSVHLQRRRHRQHSDQARSEPSQQALRLANLRQVHLPLVNQQQHLVRRPLANRQPLLRRPPLDSLPLASRALGNRLHRRSGNLRQALRSVNQRLVPKPVLQPSDRVHRQVTRRPRSVPNPQQVRLEQHQRSQHLLSVLLHPHPPSVARPPQQHQPLVPQQRLQHQPHPPLAQLQPLALLQHLARSLLRTLHLGSHPPVHPHLVPTPPHQHSGHPRHHSQALALGSLLSARHPRVPLATQLPPPRIHSVTRQRKPVHLDRAEAPSALPSQAVRLGKRRLGLRSARDPRSTTQTRRQHKLLSGRIATRGPYSYLEVRKGRSFRKSRRTHFRRTSLSWTRSHCCRRRLRCVHEASIPSIACISVSTVRVVRGHEAPTTSACAID